MTDIVAALLREREHYLRRNLPDRAAAVTAELEKLGHVEPPDAPETTAVEAPPETAIPPRPRPRRSNPDGYREKDRS